MIFKTSLFFSGPTTFKVILSNVPNDTNKEDLEAIIKDMGSMEINQNGDCQIVTLTYQTKDEADK